jgi:UDP-glucose 4-epimerase
MATQVIGLTGAGGMLGRHLRAALDEAGMRVAAVGRQEWDLRNWCEAEQLDRLFAGAGAVVHAAALVPKAGQASSDAQIYDANVRACVNLGHWALARGVAMVFVSGAIVYADPHAIGADEGAALGWSGLGGYYGFSKLLAEDALLRMRQSGLKVAIVRPSSIYGSGLPAEKMISRFIAAAKAGQTITLAPPVDDRVDLVHAADVAAAIRAILEKQAWDTFNIASGGVPSIAELAHACLQMAGHGAVRVEGVAQARLPVTRYALDTGKARERLGWQPGISLAEGLAMSGSDALLPRTAESALGSAR